MKTSRVVQSGNPNPDRFRLVRHPALEALPGVPHSGEPAHWEVVDKFAYSGEKTDPLGFVRDVFDTKKEAVHYMRSRNDFTAQPVTQSLACYGDSNGSKRL